MSYSWRLRLQDGGGGRNDAVRSSSPPLLFGALVGDSHGVCNNHAGARGRATRQPCLPCRFRPLRQGGPPSLGTVTTTLTFTGFRTGARQLRQRDRRSSADARQRRQHARPSSRFVPARRAPVARAPGNGSGTFTVASGTGRFSGASGSGQLSVQATGVPLPSDTAHYDRDADAPVVRYARRGGRTLRRPDEPFPLAIAGLVRTLATAGAAAGMTPGSCEVTRVT